METRTVKVYEYHELSEKAREKARYDFESGAGGANWVWSDEYLTSIKALAAHFGGEVTNYSLDWSNSSGPSSMTFEMPEMAVSEIRKRLAALGSYNKKTLKGLGDCKLTGTCCDESAIDGFRTAFIRGKEMDLEKLMQAAFATWIEAAWADYAYDFGDEGFKEVSEANEYRYLENGEVAP